MSLMEISSPIWILACVSKPLLIYFKILNVYFCLFSSTWMVECEWEQEYERRERKRKRESSIHWLTTQILATARARPIWSQEPGISCKSPMWVSGMHLKHHMLLLSIHCEKAELKVQYWGLEQCSDLGCRHHKCVLTSYSRHHSAYPNVALMINLCSVCGFLF